jgi:endonuclease/exonuclease/phosphatase family metal-dependent hydrolase
VSLRLASVNLFSGRVLGDGRIDTAGAARAVAALDADVLALQEVDHCQPRSGNADQAAIVAAAAGAAHHRFVPLVAGTPGVPGWSAADPAAPPPPGPGYGIALACRRPVARWHVLSLRPAPGRWPIPLPSRPSRVLWLRDEPRAAIAAVLGQERLVVACTHLSFVPGVNAWQLRQVRGWLAALAADAGAAAVLLGDLNLPGRIPARLTGWSPLVNGPTYPAPAPRLQIDHILADGLLAAGALCRGQVVALPFSDHRAIVADIPETSGRTFR